MDIEPVAPAPQEPNVDDGETTTVRFAGSHVQPEKTKEERNVYQGCIEND